MKREEKETYRKYIKEFDPSLNDEYIESLVQYIYMRSNLYVDKIGLWIAYNDCHEELRHGKIIDVKGDMLVLKKKNGNMDFIDKSSVLGVCNKPTKTNKNPKIYPLEKIF